MALVLHFPRFDFFFSIIPHLEDFLCITRLSTIHNNNCRGAFLGDKDFFLQCTTIYNHGPQVFDPRSCFQIMCVVCPLFSCQLSTAHSTRCYVHLLAAMMSAYAGPDFSKHNLFSLHLTQKSNIAFISILFKFQQMLSNDEFSIITPFIN